MFFELADLASVIHGQEVTLQGRVTEVARDPRSDNILSTDTFRISDGHRCARILMLDPHALAPHVGHDVIVHRVLCTRTDVHTELHIYATSDTVLTTTSTSPSDTIEACTSQAGVSPMLKFAPSPCCANVHTRFCSSTGDVHTCDMCEMPRNTSPFCCMTGISH